MRAQLCGSKWSTVSESHSGCSLSLRMFVFEKETPSDVLGSQRQGRRFSGQNAEKTLKLPFLKRCKIQAAGLDIEHQ